MVLFLSCFCSFFLCVCFVFVTSYLRFLPLFLFQQKDEVSSCFLLFGYCCDCRSAQSRVAWTDCLRERGHDACKQNQDLGIAVTLRRTKRKLLNTAQRLLEFFQFHFLVRYHSWYTQNRMALNLEVKLIFGKIWSFWTSVDSLEALMQTCTSRTFAFGNNKRTKAEKLRKEK